MRLSVLNGPNLNLLGTREPEIYGTATLADIERMVREEAGGLGASVNWFQSNHEGELVEAVHALQDGADGAIINAAALSHTSLALRDAVLAVRPAFVEVHLSNVFAREPERRQSVLADLAVGVVAGFGPRSYILGVHALVTWLRAA
ncbi:MAG: type II 3-dehydroquinate dehydratase [Gemmatimonadales bacterium]